MFDALKQLSALRGALDGVTDLQSVLPMLAAYGITGEVVPRDRDAVLRLLKGAAHAIGGASAETIKLTGEVNGRRVFAVLVSAEPVGAVVVPAAVPAGDYPALSE